MKFRAFQSSSSKKTSRSSLPIFQVVPRDSSGPRRRSGSFASSGTLCHIERTLHAVEYENAKLRFMQTELMGSLESELREKEILSFEHELAAEKNRASVIRARILEEQNQTTTLLRKADELSRFIIALSDIGLRESASLEDLIIQGMADIEQATVKSVESASSKPGTVWHRIIALATAGLHPSEDYVLAIQRICDDRVRVMTNQNIGDFWKSLAKHDEKYATVITPAHSATSIQQQNTSEIFAIQNISNARLEIGQAELISP